MVVLRSGRMQYWCMSLHYQECQPCEIVIREIVHFEKAERRAIFWQKSQVSSQFETEH